MVDDFRAVFNIEIDPAELAAALPEKVKEKFSRYLVAAVLGLKKQPEVYEAAQHLVLNLIDANWSSHLELMDILKEESGLFSYANEDPLIDFITQGGQLYQKMNQTFRQQFLKALFLHVTHP
jgi:preprotein translocase subunit SecA